MRLHSLLKTKKWLHRDSAQSTKSSNFACQKTNQANDLLNMANAHRDLEHDQESRVKLSSDTRQ